MPVVHTCVVPKVCNGEHEEILVIGIWAFWYSIFLLARLDYLLYKAEAGVEVTAVVEVRT